MVARRWGRGFSGLREVYRRNRKGIADGGWEVTGARGNVGKKETYEKWEYIEIVGERKE